RGPWTKRERRTRMRGAKAGTHLDLRSFPTPVSAGSGSKGLSQSAGPCPRIPPLRRLLDRAGRAGASPRWPPRSEREGHAGHRAVEALVQAHRGVAAVAADVELEPVVSGVDAEVLREAVLDQGIGAGEVAVVVAEVAPVGIQVLALGDEAPALVRGVEAQAHADHGRGAGLGLARGEPAVVAVDRDLGGQLRALRTELQADAGGGRLDHGEVVDQAAQVELRVEPRRGAGGDRGVAEHEVLAQGVVAILRVAEVVEQQAVAVADPE